jgi:hypothetical protein
MAAVMKMNTQQYAAWLRLNTLKTAAALKVLHGHDAPPPADDTDAQLKSMADFRAQVYGLAATANLQLAAATSEIYSNPPDPYETGLAELRRQR